MQSIEGKQHAFLLTDFPLIFHQQKFSPRAKIERKKFSLCFRFSHLRNFDNKFEKLCDLVNNFSNYNLFHLRIVFLQTSHHSPPAGVDLFRLV